MDWRWLGTGGKSVIDKAHNCASQGMQQHTWPCNGIFHRLQPGSMFTCFSWLLCQQIPSWCPSWSLTMVGHGTRCLGVTGRFGASLSFGWGWAAAKQRPADWKLGARLSLVWTRLALMGWELWLVLVLVLVLVLSWWELWLALWVDVHDQGPFLKSLNVPSKIVLRSWGS